MLDIALNIFHFVLLMGAIYYYANKPVGEFLQQRSANIASLLNRAESERKAAEVIYAQVRGELEQLTVERKKMLADAPEKAARLEAEQLAAAHAQAAQIVAQAKVYIDQELVIAKQSLRAEAAALALELAARSLKASIKDKEQQALAQNSIQSIGELH